jgi:CRP-like cAMP-binding protein
LSRDPEDRRKDDLKIITELLQKLPYLSSIRVNRDEALQEEDFVECARNCELRTYEKGEHIFQVGDKPREMYIIFSGEVAVIQDKEAEQEALLKRRTTAVSNFEAKMKQVMVEKLIEKEPTL